MIKRISILLLLLSVINISSASNLRDSLNLEAKLIKDIGVFKNFSTNNSAVFRSVDIKIENTLENRVNNLLAEIEKLNSESHIYRIADYSLLELVYFFRLHQDKTLSKTNQSILNQFLFELFNKRSFDVERQIDRLIFRNEASEFHIRLKLFIAISKSEFDTTVKYLNKLLASNPSLLSINILNAKLLFEHKMWGESLVAYKRIVNISSDYANGYTYIGKSYNEMEFYSTAIPSFKTSLELFPENTLPLNGMAYSYYKLEKFQDAISFLKESIVINPLYTWPYNLIGLSYRKLNEADSALKYYSKALELSPTYAAAYNNRGDLYLGLDSLTLAINDYTESINLLPENRYYYKDRGYAHLENNHIQDAISDFKKALKINYKYYPALIGIGDCYYREGDYMKAIKFYNKAHKISSKSTATLNRKANSFYMLEDYKKALKVYNKCLLINSEELDCYIGRGNVYLKQDEIIKAISDFEMAVDIDSSSSYAIGELGWAHFCANDYAKCIYFSEKAIELDVDANYAKFNIALSTLSLGKIEEAKKLYSLYASEMPSNDDLEIAVKDLRGLLGKGIYSEEVQFIIENILSTHK